MKTVTLRIPDVEEAMLKQLLKRDSRFKNLEKLLLELIREEHQKRCI